MENKEVKKRGRPRKYNDIERKQAITRSKTKYMVNKEWYCDACAGHNYTLAGKTKRLKTKKHKDNVKENIMKKITDITHNK